MDKNKTDGNDPVHAAFSINDKGDGREQAGITIREQFAIAAMQGILASRPEGDLPGQYGIEKTAEAAVKCADALIKELNK